MIEAVEQVRPISICTTKVKVENKRGEKWLVGYNLWEENVCIVAVDGKEFRGERYFCLCHNNRGMQPLD
jgi:hypothetical protein